MKSWHSGAAKIGAPSRRNHAGIPSNPVAVGFSVSSSLKISISVVNRITTGTSKVNVSQVVSDTEAVKACIRFVDDDDDDYNCRYENS